GMDPRVCAASLRSLLALGMMKRGMHSLISKVCDSPLTPRSLPIGGLGRAGFTVEVRLLRRAPLRTAVVIWFADLMKQL
ncbi:hypothetical protein, partial [Mesorhizobium sp.]|uniref:hypothetical protein n=1 Tax=Mesorhizobium sp. TaxID=1871066 RepID=UPI0025F8BA25